jgi:hypothetical protein
MQTFRPWRLYIQLMVGLIILGICLPLFSTHTTITVSLAGTGVLGVAVVVVLAILNLKITISPDNVFVYHHFNKTEIVDLKLLDSCRYNGLVGRYNNNLISLTDKKLSSITGFASLKANIWWNRKQLLNILGNAIIENNVKVSPDTAKRLGITQTN